MPLFYHIFEKNDPVLRAFGTNISDTTHDQITVQFLISPSVCCCITWEKSQL